MTKHLDVSYNLGSLPGNNGGFLSLVALVVLSVVQVIVQKNTEEEMNPSINLENTRYSLQNALILILVNAGSVNIM